jgi:hypothetical protein
MPIALSSSAAATLFLVTIPEEMNTPAGP